MPITGLTKLTQPEIANLYNGDVRLEFSPTSHRYNIFHKGVKLYGTCGVTTVVGVMDKPQLVQWSANMTNDAWIEGLSKAEKIDEVVVSTLAKTAKLAWRVKRDSAGDIGTLVHKWIEQHINWKLGKGEKPELPENDVLNNAAIKFMSWAKEEQITFTDSEKKIYSLKHNIAGTCDFLYITKDGKLGIGDIKTSKGIYTSFFYQVAAYRYMLEEERAYSSKSTPIPYEEMTIVQINKEDGKLKVKKIDKYKEYAKGFLSCSIIYRLNKSS